MGVGVGVGEGDGVREGACSSGNSDEYPGSTGDADGVSATGGSYPGPTSLGGGSLPHTRYSSSEGSGLIDGAASVGRGGVGVGAGGFDGLAGSAVFDGFCVGLGGFDGLTGSGVLDGTGGFVGPAGSAVFDGAGRPPGDAVAFPRFSEGFGSPGFTVPVPTPPLLLSDG